MSLTKHIVRDASFTYGAIGQGCWGFPMMSFLHVFIHHWLAISISKCPAVINAIDIKCKGFHLWGRICQLNGTQWIPLLKNRKIQNYTSRFQKPSRLLLSNIHYRLRICLEIWGCAVFCNNYWCVCLKTKLMPHYDFSESASSLAFHPVLCSIFWALCWMNEEWMRTTVSGTGCH